MKILHYSLGLPPYRTGGLTKFATDLMKQQIREKNEVCLLWPGRMSVLNKKISIKERKMKYGIVNYEVINPEPVPLDEGIIKPACFMRKGNYQVYRNFIAKLKPDVLHIHTFMGMHLELLIAAKEEKVRIIFTAHDFYPICSKVTLYTNGEICNSAYNCLDCPSCNATALSLKKIFFLQSRLYQQLKDTVIVKKIRKNHRDKYLGQEKEKKGKIRDVQPSEYKQLRQFYNSYFYYIDVVHYNSLLTKQIYENYLSIKCKSVIIPITHSDVKDHKHKKNFSDQLKITYLGPKSKGKGFYLLKEVLDQEWHKGKRNFLLNIFFELDESSSYIKQHNRYSYSQLPEILEKTDVVVAPSIFYETFGYTVLEALSYGVPVIISNNVGAKDIVLSKCGWIFEAGNESQLSKVFEDISKEKLEEANTAIIEKIEILTETEMNMRIFEKCYKENS